MRITGISTHVVGTPWRNLTYVLGTLFGVLVLGLIKSIIQFEGTLSSWWTKIATGVLLCAFILIQRVMTTRKKA